MSGKARCELQCRALWDCQPHTSLVLIARSQRSLDTLLAALASAVAPEVDPGAQTRGGEGKTQPSSPLQREGCVPPSAGAQAFMAAASADSRFKVGTLVYP